MIIQRFLNNCSVWIYKENFSHLGHPFMPSGYFDLHGPLLSLMWFMWTGGPPQLSVPYHSCERDFLPQLIVIFSSGRLQEKKKKAQELAGGRIKTIHSHCTFIKADPLSFKYRLSIPCLTPIFLTRNLSFCFSLWFDDIFLYNLPEGNFLLHKERFSLYLVFALYCEERHRHKQTALTWHEANFNQMRINHSELGAKQATEFGLVEKSRKTEHCNSQQWVTVLTSRHALHEVIFFVIICSEL